MTVAGGSLQIMAAGQGEAGITRLAHALGGYGVVLAGDNGRPGDCRGGRP
jgi:hypothetical protein